MPQARRALVFSPRRQQLWANLEAAAPELRRLGVTHIAFAGSFGTTDFPEADDHFSIGIREWEDIAVPA